ncbi:zinc uptake protein ZrgA [Vibrio sinaloensis]|uniref:zinc uptake protein ZrgA n=1 Tax=Photobacterium sp. (strain ATCC 43367) TaxID=379097 RepID=UPI002F41754B
MYKLSPIAALIAVTVSHVAIAEEGFRQHEAHVHGEVELNIAQDGKELLMEITAPGADVVGFEHAPKNDEQKKILADAVATLNQADSVFTLSSAAGCHVEHVAVTHTLGKESDHHDHDEHKHDDHHDHEEHKHDEHQDHDHDEHKHDDHHDHDEHKHDDHHDHDHEHSGHGEFTVEYHYHCDNIAKLETIDTAWFKQFPATEALKVNVLTDTKQEALRLQPKRTEISL